MNLRLAQLRRVAKQTVKEERKYSLLREELFRIFGPSVMVSKDLATVARAANEQLDILEATRRAPEKTRASVLIESSDHNSPEVRKIIARLLSGKMSSRFLDDQSSSVRCAAARSLPYSLVREALLRHPKDDQLRTIVRSKRLEEAGLPDPSSSDGPATMRRIPLGSAVKQQPGPGMHDEWYMRLAAKICKEYGTNIEGQWEEIIAARIASSHFATSGSKIDKDKLLQAIYDCINEREEVVMGESSLKIIARRLRRESLLNESVSVMPVISEDVDPITRLLESGLSATAYIEKAENVFSVLKSTVPAGIKKYRIGEGRFSETKIPVNGRVPGGSFTSTAEKALDLYVEKWNDRQSLAGEPYQLSWSPHPMAAGYVGFNVELK